MLMLANTSVDFSVSYLQRVVYDPNFKTHGPRGSSHYPVRSLSYNLHFCCRLNGFEPWSISKCFMVTIRPIIINTTKPKEKEFG